MQRFRVIGFLVGLALLTQTVAAKPLPRKDREPPPSGTPRVVIDTNHGKIVLELYADKAPLTVKNFLGYVDERFYDGTIFHRVIPNFMIQGGGHLPALKEKKGFDPVKNESANGLLNERGTIAVARRADPDSGTSQFFINTVDNKFLDRANSRDMAGYCVFGKVVQGMEVVDQIRQVKTQGQGAHQDVPVQDVIIQAIRRVESAAP
ncbi:MAG: peptidyl-prolyl cis-trans isomerase [Gemmataceae bacterium]|nr:peptidyl-prolyl cis-trans isomerase [Gemmataceae bacterium]